MLNNHELFKQVLTVFIVFSWLSLIPGAKIVEPAQAQAVTHPFLLVKDSEYSEMKARANESPWKEMKADAISTLNNYTYYETDSVYSTTNPPRTRHEEMVNIVSSGALAYILEEDPAKKNAYKNKIRDTLFCWDNFWLAHAYPSNGWVDTVLKGTAFFNSVLALDIIYDDLTPEERTTIETRLAIVGDAYWNAMNPIPPKSPQSWGPNGWGCAGIWALYKNDTNRISTCATKYKNSILAWLQQDDGIMPSGTGYPGARFGGGRDAKAHFMDILEYTKTPPAFYSDTTFRNFFEWLYGYTITPFKKTYSFGDTQPDGAGLAPVSAPHAGSLRDGSALFRAYKFSDAAGSYASWIYPGGSAKGTLLNYIFYTRKALEKLQSPVKPPSRIFKNGAWFLEEGATTDTKLLAAAIWNPKNFDGHGHKEVNSLSLGAYGEHVLRGSGYLGAKVSGPAPFDWAYINYNALSGNTVFIDNAGHYGVAETQGKKGAGITEGFISNKLDYARGDSGSALTNGKNYRNFVFIHPQDGKNGYWLTYDEVIATTTGNHLANVVFHPNSNSYVKVSNQEYTFNIRNSSVKLTTYLGTEPASVSIRTGYLAPGSFMGKYLYSSYPTDTLTKKKNIVTVLFPHDTTHAKANMSAISGGGYSGAKIDMGNSVIDIALESSGSGILSYNGVSFQGTAVWYRQNAGKNSGYFIQQGKSFKDGTCGFDSDNAVSIHLKDKSGKIVSSGANVKFSYPGISAVSIDGITLTPAISVPGVSMTVNVPSGTHAVSFNSGVAGTITTPVFSPAAGAYTSVQNVTISTATAGATIYYTLDGSDPASSSTRAVYSSAINISTTTTIKTKAFKVGMLPSITVSATYTISAPEVVSTPVFSPAPGTYSSAQKITILTATAGAEIRYTINGTVPTETSPVYSVPVAISANTILKAKAWKAGMSLSGIASAVYTISTLVNFAPNPGFETDPSVYYAYFGSGTFTWASDSKHTGTKSLKIVTAQPKGQFARWVSKREKVRITGGNFYTASVWMKTSNVSQYGALLINFWDAKLGYLNKYYISNHAGGTSDWTKLTVSGKAPAGAKYVRLEFRLYGPGTIWIDDAELK